MRAPISFTIALLLTVLGCGVEAPEPSASADEELSAGAGSADPADPAPELRARAHQERRSTVRCSHARTGAR